MPPMQDDESLNPVNSTAKPTNSDETAPAIDRREALEKLGKLAYTTPVLMQLLLSNRASAASCGVDPFPPCEPHDNSASNFRKH